MIIPIPILEDLNLDVVGVNGRSKSNAITAGVTSHYVPPGQGVRRALWTGLNPTLSSPSFPQERRSTHTTGFYCGSSLATRKYWNFFFKCGIADLYGAPSYHAAGIGTASGFFQNFKPKSALVAHAGRRLKMTGGNCSSSPPPILSFPLSGGDMHVRKLPGISCAFTEGSLAG